MLQWRPAKSPRVKKTILNRLAGKTYGAAMAEMGMLVGLIAILSIGAVATTGDTVSETFCKVSDTVSRSLHGTEAHCVIELGMESGTGGGSGGTPETPAPSPGTIGGDFVDYTFAEGSTGYNFVWLALDESYSSRLDFSINSSTSTIEACVQHTESDVECTSSVLAYSGDGAIGYRADLPSDPRLEFSKAITLNLTSIDDASVDDSWTITVDRTATPIAFTPAFAFSDHNFDEGTVGVQDVWVAFEGDFNGDMQMVDVSDYPQSKYTSVCVELADGSQSCDDVMVAVPQDAVAVGYRVTDLPSDDKLAYDVTRKLMLRTVIDPSINQSWIFHVTRTAVATAFNPTFAFSDHNFEAGTVGAQEVWEPLTGNFNSDMQLVDASSTAQKGYTYVCVELADGSKSCQDSLVDVPQDAVAVGYQVRNLPSDDRQDFSTQISLTLRAVIDPSVNNRNWTFQVTRTAVATEFNPTFAFSDQNFEAGTVGVQEIWEPFTGDFNGDMQLVDVTSDSYQKAYTYVCVERADGTKTCNDSIVTVPQDAAAVGYQIRNLPNDDRVDYSKQISLRLRSVIEPTLYQDWTVQVSRTAVPVEFNPTFAFSDHNFEAGTTGTQEVWVPLTGDFNGDMQLVDMSSASDKYYFYACVERADGAKTCNDTYVTVPEDAVAVGYRVTNLPSDTQAAYDRPRTLRLRTLIDPANIYQDWTFQVSRTPVTP